MFRSFKFSHRHPQSQDADVEVLPEYEEWFERAWAEYKDVAEY